jgi:hypothetical protein
VLGEFAIQFFDKRFRFLADIHDLADALKTGARPWMDILIGANKSTLRVFSRLHPRGRRAPPV